MPALVGVYLGTAAVALFAARRWIAPISLRASLGIALLPLLITGRAVFTGRYFGPLEVAYLSHPLRAQSDPLPREHYYGILSDVQILNVPWAKAVRESVKHGRLPLLNRFMMSGDALIGVFQPMVFHPSTVIGFLLPLATAWTFACAFHLFLTALCAFLFFRELDLDERVSTFGAAVWMLSNFIFFWVGWDITPAFAPFPLLLVGLRRLARGTRGGLAISSAALVLALLAGHPESVLHEVAAGGLFFLFEWRGNRPIRPAGAVGRAILAGLLAIGFSAPALFPFLEALPQTFDSISRRAVFAHERKSTTLAGAASSALLAIDPDREGRHWTGTGKTRPSPKATDGIATGVGDFALALAVVGALGRRREKWVFLGIGSLALAVAVGVPGIADVVGKVPLFDIALNGRLAGVAAFCLAALAALGLERIGESFRIGEALGLFGAAALCVAVSVSGPDLKDLRTRLALAVAPVVLAAVAAVLFRGRPRRIAVLATGLFLLARTAELPRLYPDFDAKYFYPPIPELSRLPRSAAPYRVVGIGLNLVANQGAMYELEDPRGYTSMTNARYLHLYPLWCVPQPVWFNRVDDPKRPFLSFLNVRFAIGAPAAEVPAGWREFARGPDCTVFENPGALPRAFAPASIRFHGSRQDPLSEMQSAADFAKVAWIDDDMQTGRDIANGKARVETRRRGSGLDLDVEAETPAWIVVSQTFWRGWRAEIDGAAAPLHYANVAFLALRVPAGRHRVALRFRPASVTLGFAVFAATLAVIAGVGVSRRRRRANP